MSLLDEDLSVKTDYHVLIKNMHLMGTCENLNDFTESYKSVLNVGGIVLERTTSIFYVYGFNGWICLKEIFESSKLEEYEMNIISSMLCSYFSLMSDYYSKNTFIKIHKYTDDKCNL